MTNVFITRLQIYNLGALTVNFGLTGPVMMSPKVLLLLKLSSEFCTTN